MATSQTSEVIQHLRRTVLLRDGAGLTDGQLLEHYVSRHDEAALDALVRRHGPMVWGVCRRVLRNYHDAEDAFQATFLVLVRKAASITSRELLANWLYGVAYQTARKARATAARRKGRERQVTEMPEPAVTEQDLWRDLQPLLDQELSRLPDKYRAVVVLCDLEGKTRKEAAQQLGCPEGTVAGWLARARAMLAKRLAQRGVALSGGALAAVLSQNVAPAGVPAALVSSTIKAASLFAAGQAAAAGAVSVKVAALTEGVLKTMLFTKLKVVMVLLMVAALVGGAGLIYQTQAAERPKAQRATEKADKEKQPAAKDPTKDEKPKPDKERLQGTWSVVSRERNGVSRTAAQLGYKEYKWTFKGGKVSTHWVTTDDGDPTTDDPGPRSGGGNLFDYTMAPTKRPKELTILTPLPIQAIYSFEDKDTLKLCWGFQVRPKEFSTKKGIEGSPSIWILKREGPAPMGGGSDAGKK